jgi:hypothetical protein
MDCQLLRQSPAHCSTLTLPTLLPSDDDQRLKAYAKVLAGKRQGFAEHAIDRVRSWGHGYAEHRAVVAPVDVIAG